MTRIVIALLLALLPAAAQDMKFAADRPLDIKHLRVEARVDLKKQTFQGRAVLDMVALRKVDAIRLNAVNLQVHGVDVLRGDPQQPQTAEFVNDGKTLEISLPQALRRGEKVSLRIDYTTQRPEQGLYFRAPSKAEPDVPYQMWSQGETLECRHWIPIFDNPNERLTTEMRITVADGLQVLSNGRKVSVKKNGDGTSTWHWQQQKDHVPYLITLVVGKFAVTTEEWRGKVVDYWVPPDRKADTMRSFKNTRRMLDFFSDKIGVEYPWAKYTQIVVEQFTHGGMENTSATTLTERTLHDARAHLDTSSDGLVAHELAHQWYGDLLTCRDWAHTWLNEGFATYFQALWTEHDRGDDEFRYDMRGKAASARRGGAKLPVVYKEYTGPWQQFDSRAYPKGAWVLHMIRRRLGDEMWWKAIHHYTVTNAHKCVETVDLRKAIEATTGQSFERFFFDWTERPGHPVVEVTHRWNTKDRLQELRIRQTQKSDAFHFPLTVEYRIPNDAKTYTVTHDITEKDARFFIPLPARPRMVRVDPAFSLLGEIEEKKGRNLWVVQLNEDPDPMARIRAAEYFAKSKRDADRKALADALGHEKFWGVQAQIARALGQSGGDVSRDVLLKALTLEHPKARRAVVNALGRFRDDATVRDALLGIVKNGDASYSVEADAISAWARQQPPNALATLEPLLAKESNNDIIRNAVLRGIGRQQDPAATDLLIKWTRRGPARRTRQAALSGLTNLARTAQWDNATTAKVVKALTACLHRSETRRIKTTASSALRALGEAAYPAIEALEAIAAHDPNVRVRDQAQETIDKIQEGAAPQVQLQRLRAELAKLRTANEKMRARVEKLEHKRPHVESGASGG